VGLDAEIENMIKRHEQETGAALKIQSSFRGFQSRKQARAEKVAMAKALAVAEEQKVALIAAQREAEEYKRLYEETQRQLELAAASQEAAAAAAVAVDFDESEDESDDSDDDELFDNDYKGSAKAAYLKLLDAVDAYDDALPESAEANVALVEIARALNQESLDMPPAKLDPALIVAAAQQKLGAAMVLLYSGASAVVRDRVGRTVLHVTLQGGADANIALANMLFSQGLSLDDTSSNGMTVMQHLAKDELVAELEAALEVAGPIGRDLFANMRQLQDGSEAGSDSDDSDGDAGDTDDEMYEGEVGSSSMSNYSKLLEAVDLYNDSLPESAEENAILVHVAKTFSHGEINTPPKREMEPAIISAVRQQKCGAVMALLYCGASIDLVDEDGRSLLHVLLSNGDLTNVFLAGVLSSLGLTLDDPSQGATVIEHLAAEGKVEVLIDTMREGGADTAVLLRRLLQESEYPEDDDLFNEIEDLIAEHNGETEAALCIQRTFRGFKARQKASDLAFAKADARPKSLYDAVKFAPATSKETSTIVGPFGAQLSPRRKQKNVVPPANKPVQLNEFQQRIEDMRARKLAAAVIRIQSWYRGWKSRKMAREMNFQMCNDTVAASTAGAAVMSSAPDVPHSISLVGSSAMVKAPQDNPQDASQDPFLGTYVQSLANYGAKVDGQLSYKKGDIFFVLSVFTKGWYTMEKVDKDDVAIHRGRGAVAKARVTTFKPPVAFVASAVPPGIDVLAHNKLIAYGHVLHEALLHDEFHRATRARSGKKITNEQQLAFAKHDIFCVVKKGHKQGWWEVRALNDDFSVRAVGWVPKRYLEEIELSQQQLKAFKRQQATPASG